MTIMELLVSLVILGAAMAIHLFNRRGGPV